MLPSSNPTGFRLRGVLVHEVFCKVLSLAPPARARFSSGRIFNLVTSDAETVQLLSQNILGFMSSPLRIIGLFVAFQWHLRNRSWKAGILSARCAGSIACVQVRW